MPHEVVWYSDLENEAFTSNPIDRCYHCRKLRDEELWRAARKAGFDVLADGFTVSDLDEHRPGRKASDESGIWHPLLEACLTKQDLRELAAELGMEVADKPSQACLSSRIRYHEAITKEKLDMIEKAEEHIRCLGAKQVRVRLHGNIARLEVFPSDNTIIMNNKNNIINTLKGLGFTYVTLDLEGYRSGSMDLIHTKKG